LGSSAIIGQPLSLCNQHICCSFDFQQGTGSGSKDPTIEEEQFDSAQSYVSHLTATENYLLNIDGRQAHKNKQLINIALYSGIVGSVTLDPKQQGLFVS
jgi:hypothetical protein